MSTETSKVLGEDAWAEEALTCKTKAQMITLLRAFAANMKAHRNVAPTPAAEQMAGEARPRCPKCGDSALDLDDFAVKCRGRCGKTFKISFVSDFAQFFVTPTQIAAGSAEKLIDLCRRWEAKSNLVFPSRDGRELFVQAVIGVLRQDSSGGLSEGGEPSGGNCARLKFGGTNPSQPPHNDAAPLEFYKAAASQPAERHIQQARADGVGVTSNVLGNHVFTDAPAERPSAREFWPNWIWEYAGERPEAISDATKKLCWNFAEAYAQSRGDGWVRTGERLPDDDSEVFAAILWRHTPEGQLQTTHYVIHDCSYYEGRKIFTDCEGEEFKPADVDFWIYKHKLAEQLPTPPQSGAQADAQKGDRK